MEIMEGVYKAMNKNIMFREGEEYVGKEKGKRIKEGWSNPRREGGKK